VIAVLKPFKFYLYKFKLFLYKILGRDLYRELIIFYCIDVTDQYEHDVNESFYYVEYYHAGRIQKKYIKFSGEYSVNPIVRELQKYCREKGKK